jgi:hypothetical protein
MIDIAFGSCHSFIFLHSSCSGEFALHLAKCVKARFRITQAIEAIT